GLSPVVATASALVKLTTAPLLALEAWHAWRCGAMRRPNYAVAWRAAIAAGAMIALPFVKDVHAFDAARGMRHWQQLTTSAMLLVDGGRAAGISVCRALGSGLIAAVCVALVACHLYRDARRRTPTSFDTLVLATLFSVTITLLGHVWPWFLVCII